MSRIYTKTGDGGETGLFGGARTSKSSLRIRAIGEVDELNACLGIVRSCLGGSKELRELDETAEAVQHSLFEIGAILARGSAGSLRSRTGDLERVIDRLDEGLEPLRWFILPGGSAAAAHLHLARTVCRRAERATVELANEEEAASEVAVYLNRLADLLFVMARTANARLGVQDVRWRQEANP